MDTPVLHDGSDVDCPVVNAHPQISGRLFSTKVHPAQEHEQAGAPGHPPQHHANFEHLVEHAAAQHSQAGYGEKGAHLEGALQAQGTLMRPQAHKPPQATKSSRFRGVYKRQRGGRWEASIVLDSKKLQVWPWLSGLPSHL